MMNIAPSRSDVSGFHGFSGVPYRSDDRPVPVLHKADRAWPYLVASICCSSVAASYSILFGLFSHIANPIHYIVYAMMIGAQVSAHVTFIQKVYARRNLEAENRRLLREHTEGGC